MEFLITSCNYIDDESAPCEGAFKKKVTRIDTRTCNDPRLIPTGTGSDGKWWYAEGTNHRIEDGKIKRDFVDDWWFIEIADLQVLCDLCREYKRIEIRPWSENPAFMDFHIHSDWCD